MLPVIVLCFGGLCAALTQTLVIPIQSELPQLLGTSPVRSHLVHALVQLDRDYTAEARDERWEDWYAERLLGEFGAS